MDFPWRAAVVPKEDLRFRFALEQGFDESCGFAAVVTGTPSQWAGRGRPCSSSLKRRRNNLR